MLMHMALRCFCNTEPYPHQTGAGTAIKESEYSGNIHQTIREEISSAKAAGSSMGSSAISRA